MKKIVLGLLAHPDDIEFMCAGTLSLLRKAGWEVHFASMTAGDKGSAELGRDDIAAVRKAEAAAAAKLIGARYHCIGLEDIYILYNKESINKTTALLRKIRPDVVFTASPSDYMVDHEMCSLIVQTACFSMGIRNLEVSEKTCEKFPYLYYCDAMEGKDKLGNPLFPTMYVDITNEILLKEKMLSQHDSQRAWLMNHHKIDEYLLSMKRFSEQRGKEAGVEYAEGFRQHLGHSYPQKNILKEVLEDAVKLIVQ
ncbi:MAG: PIG-L family deacetylase [Prolixibacteraceae bacterium]|jgi:LmbE family N-acetylglucosaminyl deacetylase|nr:PIG-L family deacetylase [Prolixibacteraceae bacterium]